MPWIEVTGRPNGRDVRPASCHRQRLDDIAGRPDVRSGLPSEAPAGLAELVALAEAEDDRGDDLVHQGLAALAVEGAVAYVEVPVAAVLRLVHVGDELEPGVVAHLRGLALD